MHGKRKTAKASGIKAKYNNEQVNTKKETYFVCDQWQYRIIRPNCAARYKLCRNRNYP